MGGNRDGYSDFGFYQAWAPANTTDAAGSAGGLTIDMLGFDTVQLVVNIASYCSGGANGAGDYVVFQLMHGLASAAGVSTWSLVALSQIIHSVLGGYDSTASTGNFLSLASASEIAASGNSAVYIVGYKKDVLHRYLRLNISNVGAASAMVLAATAILGKPDNWPVNTPINKA
jgi:hypothetical protein